MDSGWAMLLAGFLVAVALFLILRAFWLWYWRVNAIHARLEEIRDELRRMNTNAAPQSVTFGGPPAAKVPTRSIP